MYNIYEESRKHPLSGMYVVFDMLATLNFVSKFRICYHRKKTENEIRKPKKKETLFCTLEHLLEKLLRSCTIFWQGALDVSTTPVTDA